ncbi:ribosome assembly RNA-binding protein YhbY [sulfur-oxidizing endosymbiont of Gigantopelta aegis]|uniref:ribosome assembly RNA-binding protein YhbY n=1 Tax=sulfur-oxidizing endosymbiont of Gigantopelta aegis TaxID=2794934 RepID=UPI0018DE2854|nr:ribosome assembly RNA-binding protein YhbY [sulfur-oxidizing endosymbiont of Gigantopelta aegis]
MSKPASLNNKQIRFLRAEAHSMKPVVLIGAAGLTDNVVNEINYALDDHELIKVRVNADDRDDKKSMIDSIVRQTDSILVQAIGHIGIFYRRNEKNPVIEIPKK